MNKDSCPSEEILAAYAGNELHDEQHAIVREHLTNCAMCSNRLDHLHNNSTRRSKSGDEKTTTGLTNQSTETFTPHNQFLHQSDASSTGEHIIKPPQDIPGYKIIGRKGEGGMGVVYEGHDVDLDRRVAIKIIRHPEQASRESLFAREAQLAARLRHPNIVTIYKYFKDTNPPCLIMDLIDGVPLTEAARSRTHMQNAELVLKIASAVEHAHSKGLIHRDLKPGNILVDREGEPKILDFGLARLANDRSKSSIGGAIKGTPIYMAPEQVDAPCDVSSSADIYALGLILWELLTGVPARQHHQSDLHQIVSQDIPLPRDIDPTIPDTLQRICLKACEKKPSDRYQSAAQLADDLQRFIHGYPVKIRLMRYARLLENRVRNHLDEINRWEEEQLVTRREVDGLRNRYSSLLSPQTDTYLGFHKIRFGLTLVQLGGWIVFISALLWPVFYWAQLSVDQRILSIGIPTFIINICAIFIRIDKNKAVSLSFTVIGILLSFVFGLVLFSQLHWFEWPMAERFEFVHALREITPSTSLESFNFCNTQFIIASIIATFYSIFWTVKRRYTSLAIITCVLFFIFYLGILMYCGLIQWIRMEERANIFLQWLPWVLIVYSCANILDQRQWENLALPFYTAAFIVFVLIGSGISYYAPHDWFQLERHGVPNWIIVCRCGCFFSFGVVILFIACIHENTTSRLRRTWGNLYYKLVPPLCLVSLTRMGEEPFWVISHIGPRQNVLTVVELLAALICLCVIALGTRIQLKYFVYYGLAHLSYIIFNTTSNFFEEDLSWPLCLITIGSVFVISGILIETILMKKVCAERR